MPLEEGKDIKYGGREREGCEEHGKREKEVALTEERRGRNCRE